MTITASETMKWCRPTRVTKNPIVAPSPVQAAMAIADATQGSTPCRNSQPAITIASAVTEPTDRSIPPAMSRMVMPMTTMPSTANTRVIARIFTQVRKYGDAKDITTHSTTMIAISPVSRAPSRDLSISASPAGLPPALDMRTAPVMTSLAVRSRPRRR